MLDKKNNLHYRIAVVRMWLDVNTAEDEVIARIRNTCEQLNIEMLLIDTAGKTVDYPHRKITSDDVDFVIHLHFETPKTYDIFSFVALWNPLDFYFEWGYRKHSNNLLTHDDFLSCGSRSANDHVSRLIIDDPSHQDPELTLYHSLPQPYYEPNLGEGKVFYVGINWEKLGKGVGRHDDLLKSLDSSGQLSIYGPDVFQGVRVWDGYKSYVGPLPFDGVSVIHAIHKAGIALVLSSEAHKKASLMSSRLFEGLAAGAVIICDENPFAKQHFGDLLLYIETIGKEPEAITNQVKAHLKWIENNPEKAIEKAKQAQAIFKNKFDMALSLQNMYEKFEDRKATIQEQYLSKNESYSLSVFALCLKYSKNDVSKALKNIALQRYSNLMLYLVIDTKEYEFFKLEIDELIENSGLGELVSIYTFDYFIRDSKQKIKDSVDIGNICYQLIDKVDIDELYSFLLPCDELFSEHYSALVNLYEKNSDLECAYSNILLKHGNSKKTYFDIKTDFYVLNSQYNAPNGFSRFVFKKKESRWLNLSLPYFSWGVFDALIAKSKITECVNRASAIIDIEKLPYSSKMDYLLTDSELLEDILDKSKHAHFLSKGVNDSLNTHIHQSKKLKLNQYSIHERKEIIAHLMEALELPNWLMNIFRRVHSLFSRNG